MCSFLPYSFADVNECLLPDLENCSSLDICVNELGSFRCDCIEGYERKADDSCGGEKGREGARGGTEGGSEGVRGR